MLLVGWLKYQLWYTLQVVHQLFHGTVWFVCETPAELGHVRQQFGPVLNAINGLADVVFESCSRGLSVHLQHGVVHAFEVGHYECYIVLVPVDQVVGLRAVLIHKLLALVLTALLK